MFAVQVLFLAACCCSVVLGVIHNLDPRDAEDAWEPFAVEMSPDDQLRSIAETALGPDFRSKRQANGTDFGTTVRLNGTNRHFFALVHWTGHPSEVLFIVTMTRRDRPTDSCLWRSTDYGRTFTNDTYKLNDPSVVISWYYVSPFDQYLVMVDRLQNKVFVTRDEGVSFTSYDVAFTPSIIKFQGTTVPKSTEGTLPEHILGYETETMSLYVSKDLGLTWVFLGGNISRYTWRVLDQQYESNTSLYFEKNINDTHALLMVSQDPYSEADTREFDPALGPIKINSTVFSHEFIMVQKYHESALVPLWVSTYRRPFQHTSFRQSLYQDVNFGQLMDQDHYAVMDASEHRVFLAVEHGNSSDVHLYISDEGGVDYSLSIDHVVATEDWGESKPSFDIHVVGGMDGTYMVNVYTDDPDTASETPAVNTLISYNKGALWRSLVAPAVDSEGQPTLCQPPLCSLHLRMDTDAPVGYSSIRSKRSAIGLILAQGNVGESQVDDVRLLRVYLSRDGGFSWVEVERGHWTFQLVALGSIIVMAPKRTTVDPLNFVVWSCDEGVTWTRFNFTTTPMRLIGLLAQKGEKARRLTLFGYLRGVRPFAWLIVDLDFTVAVPNQCSYPEDYFEWVPSDGRPDSRCVLGLEKTYERRNGTICCYVDPEYERAVENSTCACSRQDFECDVGYVPDTMTGECVGPYIPPPANCTEGGYYYQKSGYRKVVGDQCQDLLGSPFLHLYFPCPPEAPGGLNIAIQERKNPAFATGDTITMILTQQSGWNKSTLYTWDFGDGTVVSGTGLKENSVMTHQYSTSNIFTVHVKASNPGGYSDVTVEVFIGDIPPVIDSLVVGGDYSGHGKPLTFTLELSEGYATVYEWDFGDGTKHTTSDHKQVEVMSHVYKQNGVYTVQVTAINPIQSSSISLVVHVGEVLPHGLSIEVEGDRSKAGEKLVFSLTQERGLTTDTVYRWDFGDGSYITEKGLENAARQTHTYRRQGYYTVRVIASNEGGTSSVSKEITIGSPEPQPTVDALTSGGSENKEGGKIGLGVGMAFLILIIVLVVAAFIVVLFWYRKQYRHLQGEYKTLQAGTGVPMDISISASELQEDFGYSKNSEADDKALISESTDEQ